MNTAYHDKLLAIQSAAEKLGPKSKTSDRLSSYWKQVADDLQTKLNEQEAKIEAFSRQAHVISDIDRSLNDLVAYVASLTQSKINPDTTIQGKIEQITDAMRHLQLTPEE